MFFGSSNFTVCIIKICIHISSTKSRIIKSWWNVQYNVCKWTINSLPTSSQTLFSSYYHRSHLCFNVKTGMKYLPPDLISEYMHLSPFQTNYPKHSSSDWTVRTGKMLQYFGGICSTKKGGCTYTQTRFNQFKEFIYINQHFLLKLATLTCMYLHCNEIVKVTYQQSWELHRPSAVKCKNKINQQLLINTID